MVVTETEKPKEKKTRQRSPNYPAVGLREAVQRVKMLWDQDGKAGAPEKIAAQHIGFKTAHGQALSVLAALKKFGLVESVKDRMVPTQRAIEIIALPDDDPRRSIALRDAVLSPTIYRELIEQHINTGFPSDEALHSELVAYKSFNRNSVANFVDDLRDSLNFAGLSDLSQLKSEVMAETAERQESNGSTGLPGLRAAFEAVRTEAKMLETTRPIRKYHLDISIPRNLTAELAIVGELKVEDLQRLKKQIDRLVENLSDAFRD